jgi:DNA-binding response OmpR family regulator
MVGESAYIPPDVDGRLEIRPDEHAALVDGRPLSLTMRELQLLTTLASHRSGS